MNNSKTIQVFEHSFLPIKGKFKQCHFVALSKLNALHNYQYFDLRHNGIKFKQFVGVIQVAGLTIEILPKIDNHNGNEVVWQNALIEMLRVTKKLKVKQIDQANVRRQNIHLLDLYFEWFLNEVNSLIHQGLIKQYYKETSNVKALKGKLEFSRHINKNLVHKERFYTSHQIYDKDHLVHQILFKALDIIEKCTKGSYLYSKCKTVQLDFPEAKNISVTEATFSKISKSRKTAPYQTALNIAKFIILNFAPNVSSGTENMIALLFDMNSLWEAYVLARLKQSGQKVTIHGQQSTLFWNGISIKPDIVIEHQIGKFIIDTKWKNISNNKPSPHDLRQMYVYNDYWESTKAMLLYPSNNSFFESFEKFNNHHIHSKYYEIKQHECGIGKISIFKKETNILDENIGDEILKWFIENKEPA